MKKVFAFIALACLLGNSTRAQNRGIMKPVTKTETIDFTVFGGKGNPGNGRFSIDDNLHPQVDGEVVSERITVDNKNDWGFWGSDTYELTYLQKNQNSSTNYVYLSDLKADDVVTIWGEVGNGNNGAFNIIGNVELLNTTYHTFNGKTFPKTKEYKILSDGTATIQLDDNYSGILKITIQYVVVERETPHFDYDPSYEEYDMYDEFSSNDIKKVIRYDDDGNPEDTGEPYTSYTFSQDETGFNINGNAAKYIILHDSKITANNRIAIDQSGDWRFNFGLRAPSNDNGVWGVFSIPNLREGDRVVFSYTGTPPVFSSVGGTNPQNGPYNGCKAFADQYNDGIFDEGEDFYITHGSEPKIDWYRGEGAIYREDHNNEGGDYQLYYTHAYVIAEDGHLDIAIAPDTRIVKIKIYSDHQASMVDEYDENTYVAKFDITGELQANEHIVPGGLEVHVGSDDASQHAHVVSAVDGPVSIINGVDGFKLPGMSRDGNGNLQFQFDLQHNLPQTGTFYRFIPLEEGKMTLRFEATSMNYYRYDINGDAVYFGNVSRYNDNNWTEQFDRPNEQTVDVECPYYLVKVKKNGQIDRVVWSSNANNGDDVPTNTIDVHKDEIYYLYGGWNTTGLSFNGSGQGQNNIEYFPYGAGNGGHLKACGVAKLFEIQFNPKKKIYPLAKWVPNDTRAVNTSHGVPNPDNISYDPDKLEYELADLTGYNEHTKITVKKMSGNITACHPYLQHVNGEGNHYKLMIDGIEYAQDKNPGGTILIKIGEPGIKSNPVYTLTVAYSADPQYNGQKVEGTRGHIWDYSTNSLKGLTWNAPHRANGAVETDYGTYFENYFEVDLDECSSVDEVLNNPSLIKTTSGLLHDEMSNGDTDWKFNYNLVNSNKLFDPLFMNKYDMEGDNADMIWDTEGTVFQTSSNQSVMFNEYRTTVRHDTRSETKDPDRYVGILKGGTFRIPWLMKDDRVIIYMGTGKGAFNDQAVFSIRNARDAVYNEIDPSDEYIVGGSKWSSDSYYHGCYHFFATGDGNGGPADMVFKMTGGSMCKIYSIQIYRGDRIFTNEIEGDSFYQVARRGESGVQKNTWNLKYYGKEEKLANGVKGNTVQTALPTQENDVVAFTGQFEDTPALVTESDELSFSYNNTVGDIGTIRVRAKDMEKNNNYVADYAERNVTIAYQETMDYPYTWDFTDVTPYSGTDIDSEWDDQANVSDSHHKLSLWDADGKMRLNSQEEDPFGYDNIFESNSEESANQLWANGKIIPETQGLLFYMDSNEPLYNGTMQLTSDGLRLVNAKDSDNKRSATWNYKMVIPSVPANAEVYLRMQRDAEVADNSVDAQNVSFVNNKFQLTNMNQKATMGTDLTNICKFFGTDTGDDKIVAIRNTSDKAENLTFSLNGWILKKVAVSVDRKKIGKTGYTTESRDRVIDHRLTSFFTAKPVKAYIGTVNDDHTLMSLTEIDIMAEDVNDGDTYDADNADHNGKGCILYNAGAADSNTGKTVKVFDDGTFNLFVPDMHLKDERTKNTAGSGTSYTFTTNFAANALKACLNGGFDLAGKDETKGITRYILSAQPYMMDDSQYGNTNRPTVEDGKLIGFYKVNPRTGAHMQGNQAYVEFTSAAQARIDISFDMFEEDIDNGVATKVDGMENVGEDNGTYITISGQHVNTPAKGGIYIKNGKKIVVK